MARIDFSGLDKLASMGKGSTSTASTASATPQAPASPAPSPRRTEAAPFTDTTGQRNYFRLYRAALDFHTRHYPPTVDAAYWQGRSLDDAMPPTETEYWDSVGDDMVATLRQAGAGTDGFLISMLWAIADELKREYDRLRQEAASPHSDGQEAASSYYAPDVSEGYAQAPQHDNDIGQ